MQEAGDSELTLEIGESLLRERLPKAFKQDVVLTMALAYVDLSRDVMALSPPLFIAACDFLERALKLLQVIIFLHFNFTYVSVCFILEVVIT